MVLTVMAFVLINGDEMVYKIVGYGCLVLQIPLLVGSLIFITESGGTIASATIALDTTIKGTLVFVNVMVQILFLYHIWQSIRVEG